MSAPAHGSPAFKKAVNESKTLKQQPNNDEMLEVWLHFRFCDRPLILLALAFCAEEGVC